MVVSNNDNTITITGDSIDLEELNRLITMLLESKNKIDHIHIDDLTLLSEDSEVKELIIEKKDE